MRESSQPFAPVDGLCHSCTGAVVATVPVAWHCASGNEAYGSGARYVGLISDPSCLRVGTNASSTAGHWAPASAAGKMSASVCCK